MDLDDLLRRAQAEEYEHVIETIEGEVPEDLRGTTLRNGAALTTVGPDRLGFFDGIGAIGGVEFGDGPPYFRSRFVRTELYEEEKAAGRMTRRRPFTNLPRRWSNVFNLEIGNPANHAVYCWQGKLYIGDSGHYAVDPKTFDVLGSETWRGVIGRGEQMAPLPRIDPRSGHLIGYRLEVGLRSAADMLELDGELQVVNRRRLPVRGIIHDQIATPSYLIVVDNPGRVSVVKALLGGCPISHAIDWSTETPPQIVLVRRDADEIIRCDLPEVNAIFHFVNAYEESGRVVLDTIANTSPVSVDIITHPDQRPDPPRPSPSLEVARYTVDLETRTVDKRVLCERAGDLPEIDRAFQGRRYRYTWMVGLPCDSPDPFSFYYSDQIIRVDCEQESFTEWRAGRRRMVGQPTFARRQGSEREGDGYLLVWVNDLDRERTELVILDAERLQDGPRATLDLGAYLPPPNHCCFDAGLRIR